MPGSFLDTTVLLYQLSTDAEKAERADALVRGGGTISVQVLNEIANVARRKIMFAWNELHSYLETVRALLVVVPLDVAAHDQGLRVCARYGMSIYDGMIVGAALAAKCDILWSEDMQDGMLVDGVLRIRNPFSNDPARGAITDGA